MDGPSKNAIGKHPRFAGTMGAAADRVLKSARLIPGPVTRVTVDPEVWVANTNKGVRYVTHGPDGWRIHKTCPVDSSPMKSP